MAILLIVLTLALIAFFSGAEIAFATTNRLRAEVRAQRGGFLGQTVRRFLHDPPSLLTTTLAGGTAALVAYATLVGVALDGPLTAFWSGALGTEAVAGLVLVSQVVLAALFALVFGVLVPKALLHAPGERVVFALALPLRLACWLFLPLVRAAAWASGALARVFGEPAESVRQFLRRDLERVVREAGGLDPASGGEGAGRSGGGHASEGAAGPAATAPPRAGGGRGSSPTCSSTARSASGTRWSPAPRSRPSRSRSASTPCGSGSSRRGSRGSPSTASTSTRSSASSSRTTSSTRPRRWRPSSGRCRWCRSRSPSATSCSRSSRTAPRSPSSSTSTAGRPGS